MKPNLEDLNLPVYTIGVAADLVDVSVHTLRLYESAGIFSPKRTETRRRLYSINDIQRLKCVRKFIEEDGLNIAGIKMMLSLIPCWDIKPCSEDDRKNCDAYHNVGKPCWIVKNRGGNCDELDCRECKVYLSVADCTNMKEFLKKHKTPV